MKQNILAAVYFENIISLKTHLKNKKILENRHQPSEKSYTAEKKPPPPLYNPPPAPPPTACPPTEMLKFVRKPDAEAARLAADQVSH